MGRWQATIRALTFHKHIHNDRLAIVNADRATREPEQADGAWLSIDAACKLLGVDQSTLRRWSDSGKIPVFRTPGGHRRYNEDDLRALVRGEPRRRRVSRQVLTTMSMSAYEHDYIRQAQTRPWYRAYDQRTLDELRPLGRRMVDLTIRYISSRGERERHHRREPRNRPRIRPMFGACWSFDVGSARSRFSSSAHRSSRPSPTTSRTRMSRFVALPGLPAS